VCRWWPRSWLFVLRGVVLMGGTLTSLVSVSWSLCGAHRVVGHCVVVGVWGWGFIGALLGSEGTHVGVCCLGGGVVWFIRPARVQCCSLVGVGGGGVGGWLVVGVGGCRVLFENCTVDASILFCVVVKLLRAHGGCLGTRSR